MKKFILYITTEENDKLIEYDKYFDFKMRTKRC